MQERKWILLVDDEDSVREMIREKVESTITDRNIKIVEAKDGVEASQKLSQQVFDCILTDLKMPRRNGDEFIKIALDSRLNATTPIVVVTGFPDPDLSKRYPQITFLEKPFKSEALIQMIISQLTLGPTDQRLATYLVNPYIEATVGMTTKLTGGGQREKPMVKANGQDLPGLLYGLVTLKFAKRKHFICFGFDQGALDELKAHAVTPEGKGPGYVGAVKEFCALTYKKACEMITEHGSAFPEMDRVEICPANASNTLSIRPNDQKGLVIPLKTPKGTICLFAIAGTGSRSRSAA